MFAKDHENKDISFCTTVIFGDRSKFNISASDGRIYLWRGVVKHEADM